MSTFVVKMTSKKYGVVSYYANCVEEETVVDGTRMRYNSYIFTNDEDKARVFYEETSAREIVDSIRYNKPQLMEEATCEIVHKITDKERIVLNIRPFQHITTLLRGYKKASEEGKEKIRQKLFDNDDLYNACDYAIKELIKFKKYCKK